MKTRNGIRLIAAASIVFVAAFAVSAQVSFENPDLNSKNEVLFAVNTDIPGSPAYRTLFWADASQPATSKIISCYPEALELLSGGDALQLRNRFGTARYSIADGTLSWLSRSDSVPADAIRLEPYAVSPDGKYECFVRKTSIANGQLILRNTATLSEKVLDTHADFSYEHVPVRWAPDGATVIYEKNDTLYFCDPKAAFQQVQMTEEFRKIGTGHINALCWANNRLLFYIDHDVVYKISANELYTRGLYAPMVGSGTVCGRLPIPFDGLKDRFWASPDGNALVVVQSDKLVASYSLRATDTQGLLYLPVQYSKPFSDVRGSVIDFKLFWLRGAYPLLWVDLLAMDDGSRKSAVYQLSGDLVPLSLIDEAGSPQVNADGTLLAFSSGDTVYVYDVVTWKLYDKLIGESAVSYVWKGNDTLFVGGVATIREWQLSSERMPLFGNEAIIGGKGARTLFLSSGKRVFWMDDSIIRAEDASRANVFYDYNSKTGTWSLAASQRGREGTTVQNGRYRVFVGSTVNELFANALYVRTLSGNVVTRALFADTAEKRAGRKKLALIFDAVDSADGVTRILSVLKEYRVSGTFFLNGEFIRRYPSEAKQLVASGYECASSFFTAADLTGKDFVVDDDFIKRGLARNEDEFFAATGSELSLYWHAPLYKATAAMKKAGEAAGYRYVDAGRLSLDTVTLENAVSRTSGTQYLTASQIISYYIATVQAGYVIPISTGIARGTRSDYLYEKLDLLIAALLDAGFELVSLKTLL